jgi:hypothetical protein
MSSKNVNSFSTIDTINTYSNSSLLGIVSGNLTRLTSGNLVLNKVNATNLVYNTGNQTVSGLKSFSDQIAFLNPTSTYPFNPTISGGDYGGASTLDIDAFMLNLRAGYSKSEYIELGGEEGRLNINTVADTSTFNLGTHHNASSNLSYSITSPTISLYGQVNGQTGTFERLFANNLVYNTGNQIIFGNKSFYGNTIINNLTVTGTETIVNTSVLNVANPYILLNISGGATDGGIFFVTGVGLTGINDTGPIIGFDHTNKFKFGISTRNSDLSPLPDIASVQEIRNYSGVANTTFSTITDVAFTGSTLNSRINTLSGVSVLTFGNQTISGVKNFSSTPTVNNTGVLLTGQNIFVLQGGTTQSNTSVGDNYIGLAGGNIGYSNTSASRRVVILENCVARKASITLQQEAAGNAVSNITGSIVNFTQGLTGIISTTIASNNNNNFINFSNSNLNLPFSAGDNVGVLIHSQLVITGLRAMANVYFYN